MNRLSAALRWLGLALCCLAWSPAHAEPAGIGTVAFVIGTSQLSDPQGASQPLQRGTPLFAGQRIETGDNGHVHVRFIDGASVAVRPRSRLLIHEYHYVPERPADNRVRFLLEQGEARSITGKAGEAARERFRLNTPVAAIGIKGTDFVVQVSPADTRVFVLGGAIVMSPFGPACTADGLGVCAGEDARELAALPGRFLRLSAVQRPPELIVQERRDEAAAPRGSHLAENADPVAAKTLAVRADGLVAGVGAAEAVPPGPRVAPGMEDIVPRIWWGRRAGHADPDVPASDYAYQLGQPNRLPIGGLGIFRMLRERGYFPPLQGSFDFALASSEAYLVQGYRLTPLAVHDGSLTLNFDAGQFATRFGVGSLNLGASGNLDVHGRFASPLNAATRVDGVVVPGAAQAGFTFRHDLAPGRYLSGATLWSR